MKCPACEHDLTEMTIQELEIDICKGGCGGIWFDNWEIQRVDEPHEGLGEDLLDIETDPEIVVDHTKKRLCPKCDGMPLMRHFFSVKQNVEVDECPSCGGFWLDPGELADIRSLFRNEEELKEAAENKFDEMFNKEFGSMMVQREQRLEKAKSVARLFRFLLPSYYLPGDQDWGAY